MLGKKEKVFCAMANVGLVHLRQLLDDAMTYADMSAAKRLAAEGLRLAQEKELGGEIAYFKAQREILEGNDRDAISYLDLAIEHNPCDGAAYNDRALCLVELGLLQEALLWFDRGIEREPDYANIYHNKGWLLNKLGQHQEAVSFFEKALALEPCRAVTYENLADVYINLGATQKAIKAFQQAAELLVFSHPHIKDQIDARLESLMNG